MRDRVDHACDRIEEVFAVVEHQQQPLGGEVVEHRLLERPTRERLHPQRRRKGLPHDLGSVTGANSHNHAPSGKSRRRPRPRPGAPGGSCRRRPRRSASRAATRAPTPPATRSRPRGRRTWSPDAAGCPAARRATATAGSRCGQTRRVHLEDPLRRSSGRAGGAHRGRRAPPGRRAPARPSRPTPRPGRRAPRSSAEPPG